MSDTSPIESPGHVCAESPGHVLLLTSSGTGTFYMLSDSNNLNTAFSRMAMANYTGSGGMQRGYVFGTADTFADVTIFFLQSSAFPTFSVGLTLVNPASGSLYTTFRSEFPSAFPSGGAWVMFDTEFADPSNPAAWNFLAIKSDISPLLAVGQYTAPAGGPNNSNQRTIWNWHRVFGTPTDLNPTRPFELQVDSAVVAEYVARGGTWDGKLTKDGGGGPTWSGAGGVIILDTGDSPLNWRLYGTGGETGYLNYRLSATSGEQQFLPFGTYTHFPSFTGVYPDSATITIWPP